MVTGVSTNCANVAGMSITDEAKMTGMTPAMFTLSGMNVLCPPIIRRPTTRFAYWTGMRRSPVVIQITATTTASAMARNSTIETMLCVSSFSVPDGMRDTMLMKIMIDMPLPMPRAVMSSPSHITATAPATRVETMRAARHQLRSGSALYCWKRKT